MPVFKWLSNTLLCKLRTYFHYPLFCWWASRLFTDSDYYEQGRTENVYASVLFVGWRVLWDRTQSVMPGSWSKSISVFLTSCYLDFHSGSTSFPFHQQWITVPLTPHAGHHKLQLVLLNVFILRGAKWNLKVVLVWIPDG